MAPSSPSSGAGATFTEIDLARWTLTQCRAKCWALGLPEYGLLSQLRCRLSRWRTAQPDATGKPVTTPPAGAQPPPGDAPLAPAPFADYAPPPPPPPTTVSSRRAPVANERRPLPPIPLNDDGLIKWIVRPSPRRPQRPKLRATSSRSRRRPRVDDAAIQSSRRMDITSRCRRCSFRRPTTNRLQLARPTAAPTMLPSPMPLVDDFEHFQTAHRSWSWPSCAIQTYARFWRALDFPEPIAEVRPPWSPVSYAGCTRGPHALFPSLGACSALRGRPPHRTADRPLARMLAMVLPLGRPRRPTHCRSLTSMPRPNNRRQLSFNSLEPPLRPWT